MLKPRERKKAAARPPRLSSSIPFTYRFAQCEAATGCDDLFARLLGLLLDVVELTSRGEAVTVDGFRIKENGGRGGKASETPIPIRCQDTALGESPRRSDKTAPYQPFAAIAASEPRLAVAGRLLDLLGTMVQSYEDGHPVSPDGFGPRQPIDWMVPSDGDPSPVLATLARSCDSACGFCYLEANPSDMAEARDNGFARDEELEAQLAAIERSAGSASLFKTNWEIRETLADPRAIPYMQRLRRLTAAPLFFVTNGNFIDERMAGQLAELQPIVPFVSINVLESKARRSVMGLESTCALGPTTSIEESLHYLRRSGIRFGLSITAWPGPALDGLEHSLRRCATTGAEFVRVNLPGYTRHSPPVEWDTDQVWSRIVRTIGSVRSESPVPIFPIPCVYEVESLWEDPLQVGLLGVVPGSPAAAVGLRAGDVIEGVNGQPLVSRLHFLSLLALINEDLRVQVQRDGVSTEIDLPGAAADGPRHDYIGKYFFPCGLIVPSGLPSGIGGKITEIARASGCERLLVFASPLLPRTISQLLGQPGAWSGDAALQLVFPCAEYLGGNIRVMDMCVVDDFVAALDRVRPRLGSKDLALIPATSFNRWGRDLRGVHWEAIERKTGVSTKLITTASIIF